MNSKVFGYIALMLLLAFGQVQAQDSTNFRPHFEHRIDAGFNFGATTPVGIPATIRSIDAFWPEFCPALGYELSYMLHPKWGVSLGVKLDYKGMGTKDHVQYFPTIITVQDGSSTGTFEGIFTGQNKTTIKNTYFTVPFGAVFHPNINWRFTLGGYVAWKFSSNFYGDVSNGYIRNGGPTGEKILVDHATFDFSNEVRNFDAGLNGSVERRVGKRLSVMGDLSWGLRPIFSSDFKGLDFPLYNIYLMLGVSYRIM
ncbi:outer membrane beta-barrel protein [Chitinophaga sp. Cy-1792]|uniref:outer membrane beta-barrel protein n=1 Tax=Chitinophaga sp. Cy-1792 TaxID=2608339 RepID=UPI00141E9D28|nr:outer membrane beta-barrel protein [Chitinophaga sp. Cy-1792]NIG56173.1 PorT family protein [Chitinophaga sp. Cy-1792]